MSRSRQIVNLALESVGTNIFNDKSNDKSRCKYNNINIILVKHNNYITR